MRWEDPNFPVVFLHTYWGKCSSLPRNEGYKGMWTPEGRSSKWQVGRVMAGRSMGPPGVAAARPGPALGEVPGVLAPLGVQGPGGKEASPLPWGCADGAASPVRADQETEVCGDGSCLGDGSERLEDTPEK